jgi:hypothetical protein
MLVAEEHPGFEHLLEHQDHAVALGCRNDDDRHQIGRANTPGVNGKGIALPPFGRGTDRADQFDQHSVPLIRGTSWSVTGCSVSNAAAMTGKAAFLLPDRSIAPVSRYRSRRCTGSAARANVG